MVFCKVKTSTAMARPAVVAPTALLKHCWGRLRTTNGVYTVGSYDNIVCLVRHLLAYLVLCTLSDQNTVQYH